MGKHQRNGVESQDKPTTTSQRIGAHVQRQKFRGNPRRGVPPWMKTSNARSASRFGAVFLSSSDGGGEEELDLAVYGAEVLLRPGSDLVPECGRKAQQHLLFCALLRLYGALALLYLPLQRLYALQALAQGRFPLFGVSFSPGISISTRCSLPAARRGCRRAPPADWTPSPPCAPRPGQLPRPRPGGRWPS